MKSLRMTPEASREHQLKYGSQQEKKESKHKNHAVYEGNKKVADSKREYKRWLELKHLFDTGQIHALEKQVSFELVPSVVLDGRKKPAIRYVADFQYMKDGKFVIEDAKSPHLRKHPVFRMKKHMMKAFLGIDITEV